MRFAIAAMVAAGLAWAPAVAQETNQANTTAPTTVVTGPDTTLNNVAQPALPVSDEAATVDPMAPAPDAVEPAAEPEDRDDGGFPWGLIGLVGLLGLLGRSRS